MDTVTGMVMDMEMKKRNRTCMIMIKPKYVCLCLLWIVCVWPVYAQHTPVTAGVKDSINLSARERQMQARLENYVQMISSHQKRDKIRVLAMPVVGFHPSQLSYGLMVGVMKRTGGYIKAKHSFSNAHDDSFECDDKGVPEGEGAARWYTGRTEKSRQAVTGGIVQRVWRPLYLYAGAGYGNRKLVCETVAGDWGKNKDRSFNGVEAEIGAIVVFKHIVLSLGIQTNSFEYLEGTAGVGVLF